MDEEREERRQRLRLGLRRHRGDHLRPGWIAALRDACGLEVGPEDFLGLEETETLKAAFYKKMRKQRPGYRSWRKTHYDQMTHEAARLLHAAAGIVGPVPVVMFSDVDQDMGAVRVVADRILTNAAGVHKVVGGDVAITTPDLEHGLCVEQVTLRGVGEYDENGFDELYVWGIFAQALA